MKKLLLLALLFFSGAIYAQSSVCLPNSSSAPIDQVGGKLMEGRDNIIKGDWYALWCPGGNGIWTLKVHAVLDKYKTLSPTAVFQFGVQVWSSATPMTTLQDIINSNANIPPVGTKDRFDWESLIFQACVQGVTVPPVPNQTVLSSCSPPTPLPPPVLVPPVVTALVYVVTSTPTYAVKPDGTRDIRASSTPAALGSTCDCSVETGKRIANPFGGQWCKVTVASSSVLLVAGCSVKK